MSDRPIIFSSVMIQALLDGHKTMTRRLAWQEPQVAIQIDNGPVEPIMVPTIWQRVKPDDRLWVRESLQCFNRATAQYVADITPVAAVGAVERTIDGRAKWTWKQAKLPSIHMPRWASRLTLIVTGVKIERLQEITEQEAFAEGVQLQVYREPDGSIKRLIPISVKRPPRDHTGREFFAMLWCELHGADAWDANPEVVAISFAVHQQNIDSLPKQEAA